MDEHLRRVEIPRNGFCAISSACWPTTTKSLWTHLLGPFISQHPEILATFQPVGRTRKSPSVEQLQQDAMNGATHFWFPAQFVATFLAWRGVCVIVLDRRSSVKYSVTLRGARWNEAKFFRVVEYKAQHRHFFAYKLPSKPKVTYQFKRTDTVIRKLDKLLHSKEAVCGRGYHYANGMQPDRGWLWK